MNNLTQRTLLVILFVITSFGVVWANSSPTSEENLNTSKKTIASIPDAPTIAFIEVDRCGYQSYGDPRSVVVLKSSGCDAGTINWYDSDGNNLGGNSTTPNLKYLEITSDLTVYATCKVGVDESTQSNHLFVKYAAAPSTRPSIFLTKKIACEGETITLRSNVENPNYIYRWERGVSGITEIGNIDPSTKGYGTSALTVSQSGFYYLSVVSPDCPQSPLEATGQVYVEFYSLPKPTVTASNVSFCEDKSTSLKVDSTQFIRSFQWYLNGVKQDSLGSKSFIKSFNKTANVQVVAVESRLGCLSPISAPLNITAFALPTKPIITPSKTGAAICLGDTLSLSSSLGYQYKWNTGATTRNITKISSVGKYALQIIDQNGCISKKSDTTTITVFSLPAKPVITAGSVAAFCKGGSVTLTSSPNIKYIWSTNESTKSIVVNTSKDLTVAVRDVNNCLSPTSNIFKVTVYELPAKPTITSIGSLSFCADKSVIITSSDLVNGEKTQYIWSSKDSTKSITVKTSASFSVKVKDPRGCISPSSDIVTTTALPVPIAPTISADGSLIFCARSNDDYTKINSVNLLATSNYEVTWSTGFVGKTLNLKAVNSQGTFIDISREYTAFAKNTTTGCISAKSLPLTVIAKNNPDATSGSIEKDGTYTLKTVNFPSGNDYEWKYGTELLASKESTTKANRFGDYTARVRKIFAIPTAPNGQLGCFSNFSKAYTFKEEPDFKGLSIYPNPGNGLLTIETLADYDNPQILIYDLLGRQIYSGTFTSIKGKVIVDLRNNYEGEYLLRFKAGDFDLTKRIIVNR